MKKLLIVESPAKAKTIKKYLGKDFEVMATLGHVIDLPKSKLGVDVEHGYKPIWTTMRGKAVVLRKLKRAADKVDEVYLAMDPDREGEAIAWHVANYLKLENPKRITYHEIVKDAILKALENPRGIDENLVNSQFARRVLDRLVGYQLSQLLWQKIWYGLSAGRVQSVALRLIVEREEEIQKFIPEEYWEIFALLENKDKNIKNLKAQLSKINKKKAKVANEKKAKQIKEASLNQELEVLDVQEKQVKRHPYPPFTTSTLQQAANNILGFSAKRTMALAQRLYQDGYITYMRTDSVYMSDKAIKEIRKLIKSKYGEKYLSEKVNVYKNKAKLAQEAHEAIRPTHFDVSLDEIKKKLGSAEAKLYGLIFNRAVATQMADKLSKRLSIKFGNKTEDLELEWKVSFETLLFDGFRKVWGGEITKKDDVVELENIGDIKKGDKFVAKDILTEQKFTKPPARYTDATLVKALESYGVGRPSTYASIISTIIVRKYVERIKKALKPTDVGILVANFLKKYFSRLVDYNYTAKVEDDLDKIAQGKVQYEPFIDRENTQLLKEIEQTSKSVKKEDVVILGESDEKCPKCGGPMVVRVGKFGKFLSCAKFPECKGIKSLTGGAEDLDYDKYMEAPKCPKCGGEMELKIGKYGKFWACSNYPECKGTAPLLLREKCPECGHHLVERRGRWGKTFIGCSNYPKCKYIKKEEKE